MFLVFVYATVALSLVTFIVTRRVAVDLCKLCALCNGQRAIVIGFSYPHSSIETCKYCC